MKLALIAPRGDTYLTLNSRLAEFWEEKKNSILYRYTYTGFGSALLVVAALTPPAWQITFIDENFEAIPFDRDFDLIALTANTMQAPRAYAIAEAFRQRGKRVVIGGIHATVMPEEAKAHVDAVVIGEAESTWPALIDDFQQGRLQPFYRANQATDLTQSPLPRYDLLKPEHYSNIWIQTTRGCPRDCEFCVSSNLFGKTYRRKSIDQVVAEITAIKRIWPNPAISFADDNFCIDRSYARALLKAIKPFRIRWFAQSDVAVADDEALLLEMKQAGAAILFIGFESITQPGVQNLDRNNWKARHVADYAEIIRRIQRLGIGVMGAFIVGLDSDTPEIFDQMADFILRNHLYAAQITIATPIPGSRLRQRLAAEGRLLNHDWGNYHFAAVNFRPKNMSPTELEDGHLRLLRKIYSAEANTARILHFRTIFQELLRQDRSRAEFWRPGSSGSEQG